MDVFNDNNKNENPIYNKSKDKLKKLNTKDLNNLQIISNESQPISNIINVNGSLNSFSINDSKISSKALFDFPFENNDKLEEKENDIKEKNEINNNNKKKFEKLDEFIIRLNDEDDIINSNNNNDKNNSKETKSLNEMQISKLNLLIKENEEIENVENNPFNNENNYNKRNITGSIMFLDSNIDKNIHVQNGQENYSINKDGNSNTDNFNIIEIENILPKNNQNYIDKIESIKNENKDKKIEIEIENNNIYKKEEVNEYEIGSDEEKFFIPLNKYENKFNLDQINPF